jgi:ppGpp synthetase/RelA/SpoT-type nucleotidyltranferase
LSDYEEIQSSYLKVYPAYHRLAACLHRLLRERLDAKGLRLAEASARAKDPDSFVKKALRKGYPDPLSEIGDKAGARIVVPFARERERVVEICEEILTLSDLEDKRDVLGSEKIGYLGIHYTVALRPEALEAHEQDLLGLSAELQIHTKAESAWATVTHDSLYKSVIPVPDELARRVNRLSVLAEIFDDEVERFLLELASLPGFAELDAILPALDTMLLSYTPRAGDTGLSARLIPAIRGLYEIDAAAIVPDVIEPYVQSNREVLQDLYDRYKDDERANPLLYQPEALMLFERLDNDPYRLRSVWPTDIEIILLERLATLYGKRLH